MTPSTPGSDAAARATSEDALSAATLAAQIHAGDRAAEAELVQRYRRGLVLLLRRWTGDHALAEDFAHEALLIAIERLRDRPLDDPDKLGAFLRGTAHNLVIAADRRSARRRTSLVGDDIDGFIDGAPGPFESAVRTQEATLVRQLIDELGVARDRELLSRYYIAGEPKSRICDELQLDVLHFNRVLHRARLRLRTLWLQSGTGKVG